MEISPPPPPSFPPFEPPSWLSSVGVGDAAACCTGCVNDDEMDAEDVTAGDGVSEDDTDDVAACDDSVDEAGAGTGASPPVVGCCEDGWRSSASSRGIG